MTERIKGITRSPKDNSKVLIWKNDSGEVIPAYACVKLDSFNDAGGYYLGKKPDGDGSLHFVNGPYEVAVAAYSESSLWTESRLGKTDALFGETVGPTDGSWLMTTTGSGWTVFSNPVSGVGALIRDGGGGGGTHQIEFTSIEAICDPYTGVVTNLVATVDWYSLSCTARPPGMDSYDHVEIYPTCDAFEMYTTDFLMTAKGKATWMFPWGGVGVCEPQWRCDFICGSPECA